MSRYVKGKGFFVGSFTDAELDAKKHEDAIEKVKQEVEQKYVNTEYVKKRGQIVGMRFYVCSADDCKFCW